MGSGSTCQAAELLGRRWIGVDKDEGYVALAQSKMDELKKED